MSRTESIEGLECAHAFNVLNVVVVENESLEDWVSRREAYVDTLHPVPGFLLFSDRVRHFAVPLRSFVGADCTVLQSGSRSEGEGHKSCCVDTTKRPSAITYQACHPDG